MLSRTEHSCWETKIAGCVFHPFINDNVFLFLQPGFHLTEICFNCKNNTRLINYVVPMAILPDLSELDNEDKQWVCIS